MLALVLVGGVVAANATVLSASAFVRTYLDLVARGDAAGALALPGVRLDGAQRTLLDRRAMPGLEEVEITGEEADAAGVHRVTAEWVSDGRAGRSTFQVERSGSRLGLFPRWRFAVTPLAVADLTVQHDLRYRVGGILANTPGREAAAGTAARLALFTPGRYVLEHETTYLEADPLELLVAEPGEEFAVELDVRANERFREQVDAQVREYLDRCAEQTVLMPSGCPFGLEVTNRIESEPSWSIAEYPEIEIAPARELGTWEVRDAAAEARVKVRIQSLFDGSERDADERVDFDVSFRIQFGEGEALAIRAMPAEG